jgi:hypothetical protein
VLGESRVEDYWQQLFVHFLTPEEAHGLNEDFLKYVLDSLSSRDDMDFSYSHIDLKDVNVEQEVSTDEGRPDILIWSREDWFLCIEMKIDASESEKQTQRYVDTDKFGGIDLDKEDVLDAGHHYVYLAPERASEPEANEFVTVSWEWLASELRSFLADNFAEYPTRTTAQLNDFIDTIRSELTMTEYEENRQEKLELAIEHYEPMKEVLGVLSEYKEELIETWPGWFKGMNPDGWEEDEWYAHITNNRWKVVRRNEWAINFDAKTHKNSDFHVYWVFEITDSNLGRNELEHRIEVTGKDEELLRRFRDSFYRDSVQQKVEAILADIGSDSAKELWVEDWDTQRVHKLLVEGRYQFELEDARSFERTAVTAFEDLQPLFDIVTEAVPE